MFEEDGDVHTTDLDQQHASILLSCHYSYPSPEGLLYSGKNQIVGTI